MHLSPGQQMFAKLVDAKIAKDAEADFTRGWNAAIDACREAQPATAEKPSEDAYQHGYFRGVIDYGRAILNLRR